MFFLSDTLLWVDETEGFFVLFFPPNFAFKQEKNLDICKFSDQSYAKHKQQMNTEKCCRKYRPSVLWGFEKMVT